MFRTKATIERLRGSQMIKRCFLFLLIFSFFLPTLVSCRRASEHPSASFFLMDTVITVTLYADEETASEIFAECRTTLEELDRLWSRTKEESDTSHFNASSVGEVLVDPRTVSLLQVAGEVARNTDGAFDVTIAPLVLLWQACEEQGRLPTKEELSLATAAIGEGLISVGQNSLKKHSELAKIDLGGIGKGAAISALVAYIESTGVDGGIVSFGSNVAVIGAKPDGTDFRIALRDPKNTGNYAGTLTLRAGQILSVSGDYERFYEIGGERYHHILDPQTGYPAQSGLSSVAVVCDDGALADALSTALLVMGEERARELYADSTYDFEAVFITTDGVVSTTDGLILY